jgi:hypothetical protein
VFALIALVTLAAAAVVGALLRSSTPVPEPVRLVLIESAPGVEGGPQSEVPVVAAALDGTVAPLATLTTGQLGGAYIESWAALSPDGHLAIPIFIDGATTTAVVDLREPTAAALLPDVDGGAGAFGPAGLLAMFTNDGYAVFDPLRNLTSFTMGSAALTTTSVGSNPVWASTGTGLIGESPGIGTVRFNGQFQPGEAPTFYGGTGPRRIDRFGRILRCRTDGVCDGYGSTENLDQVAVTYGQIYDGYPRIADYAWGADGGIWVLSETSTPGARTVTLRHSTSAGLGAPVATFEGVPDDTEQNAYFPAASFAAMAPGDAGFVIRLSGPDASTGQIWLVNPEKTSKVRLPDGVVAGWIEPATLAAPRPAARPMTPTDPVVRGDWWNGTYWIRIGRTVISAGPVPTNRERATIEATDATTLAIGGDLTKAGCASDQVGHYGWSTSADRLRLVAIDDPCIERARVLVAEYSRELPFPDAGPLRLATGSTYVVPDMRVRFRLTTPVSTPWSVSAHRDGDALLALESGGDLRATITLMSAIYGSSDPCDRHAADFVIGSSTDGIARYLAKLGPNIEIQEVGVRDIGGRAAREFLVRRTSCSPSIIFSAASLNATAEAGTRIELIPFDDGRLMICLVRTFGAGSPDIERSTQELLDSIVFETGS